MPTGPEFHHGDWDVPTLVKAKGGRTVSVCLPARDEAGTIAAIVDTLVHEAVRPGLVDEVLVIDDASSDDTAQLAARAGARVVATPDLLADHAAWPGKGEAMWKSLFASTGDVIVFCDADVRNFGVRFPVGLLGPLLTGAKVALVKGHYQRDLGSEAREGGRVTELVARPLFSLYFPHLARVRQPLGGEYAMTRKVAEALPFVGGYGVETGILIDVARRHGSEAIAQVDLGSRIHRNRPLADLSPQALAVAQTVLRRAGVDLPGRGSDMVRPDGAPVPVPYVELPPMRELAEYSRRTA